MDLQKFLEHVLPSTGTYFVTRLTPNGKMIQDHAATLTEVAALIEKFKRSRQDVYFATGSYEGNRRQENAKQKRAFYVDIDCKAGGQYPDKKTALTAIRAAIQSGALPKPTLIVDSGNGYHLYWALDDDIPVKEWAPYAKALAKACKLAPLNVDTAITEDSARILRAPTSSNFKDHDNPKPCKLVLDDGPVYSFAELTEFLNAHLTGPAAVPAPVDNSDLTGGLATGRPASAAEMIANCPMLQHTLQTRGADQPGVLWHKILHTLAFCDDGADFVHALSDGHAEYDPGKTDRRFAYAMEQRARNPQIGPTRCDKFAETAAQCASCQWRGKMQSPIKLAFGLPSELPWPYRNNNGRLEVYQGEEEGWGVAARYETKDLKVAVDRGNATFVNFEIGGEHIDTDMSSFVDNRSVLGLLGQYGVTMNPPEIEHLKRLMNAWIEQLRTSSQIVSMVRQLGWTKGGFHYGGVVFRADGTTTPTFRHDRTLARIYEPTGDLVPWQECANHILGQPRHAAWCTIASAFAAPLLRFTGATGALLSIVSQDSGSGKSTAMKVAQAVWGDPKAGMSSLNDTANAVSNKLGTLHNLPAYWDEVREKAEVQNFIKVIFRLSQGKDKQRLTSSIQQRHAGEWATMLVIATNEPIRDHIAKHVGNSDAGAARVFEIRAFKAPPDGMDDGQARHFYARLERNYGMAGKAYAAFLAANEGAIEKQVQKLDSQLATKYNTTGDERFWVATIATLLVGAKLANQLGLCQFDLVALTNYLVAQFKSMRATKAQDFMVGPVKAVNLLARFVHENVEHIIKSERMPSRGGAHAHVILSPAQRSPVKIRIATKDKRIRLLLDDFTTWIYDRDGAGYSHIIEDLLSLGAVKLRGSVDAGALLSTSSRQVCLELPFGGAFASVYADDSTPALNADLSA